MATVTSTKANVGAGGTDTAVIAAVSGAKIAVHQLALSADGTATDITFNTKPSGAGTAISCKFSCAADGGIVLPYSPIPWFVTAAGEGLSATTGAGATVGVQVGYKTEP